MDELLKYEWMLPLLSYYEGILCGKLHVGVIKRDMDAFHNEILGFLIADRSDILKIYSSDGTYMTNGAVINYINDCYLPEKEYLTMSEVCRRLCCNPNRAEEMYLPFSGRGLDSRFDDTYHRERINLYKVRVGDEVPIGTVDYNFWYSRFALRCGWQKILLVMEIWKLYILNMTILKKS